MTAEIISVGTELLLGKVINTDASMICSELASLGISVHHVTTVGDNRERLADAIKTAKSRAQVIITTGGLGPTYDDLTKQTAAAVFGRKLVPHAPTMDKLHEKFSSAGAHFAPGNERQAMLPEDCEVFENTEGTAPGCAFETDGVHLIMLPGPFAECRAMFEKSAEPYLQKLSDGVILSRFIRFFGISESSLEAHLKPMMEKAENPTIAPYVQDGEVYLRVTARAENREKCVELSSPLIGDICSRFKQYVYGLDVSSLEDAVSRRMHALGHTLAVAESCTGGLIGARLTEIPGASNIFKGGVVSYTNGVKTALLKVPEETIERYGAVSEETAKAMAQGILEVCEADFGLSVTGLCGSVTLGGVPAGTVYVALARSGGGVICRKHNVGTRRDRGRVLASGYALKLLLDSLER